MADENKFFAIMPHMDDDDLDPFQYRLIGHIRRRGELYAQIGTIARDTKMCHHKVREALRQLLRRRRIKIKKRPGRTHLITAIDIMEENIRRYTTDGTPSKTGMAPLQKMEGPPYQKLNGTPSTNGAPALQEIEHKERTQASKNPSKNEHQQGHCDGGEVVNFLHEVVGLTIHKRLREAAMTMSIIRAKELWKAVVNQNGIRDRKANMASMVMEDAGPRETHGGGGQ